MCSVRASRAPHLPDVEARSTGRESLLPLTAVLGSLCAATIDVFGVIGVTVLFLGTVEALVPVALVVDVTGAVFYS